MKLKRLTIAVPIIILVCIGLVLHLSLPHLLSLKTK